MFFSSMVTQANKLTIHACMVLTLNARRVSAVLMLCVSSMTDPYSSSSHSSISCSDLQERRESRLSFRAAARAAPLQFGFDLSFG